MLQVFYGDMPGAIYNTSVYFDNSYEDEWIVNDLAKEIIRNVDKSEVYGPNLIISPVLGGISPKDLSGGTKTLLLAAFDKSGKVFNASNCGDNCAKWFLSIAKTRNVIVNLRHMMDFGKKKFEVEVLNNGFVAHNMTELASAAGEFVWGGAK